MSKLSIAFYECVCAEIRIPTITYQNYSRAARCPNELSSVCIKYLKAEILQAKKRATCHARKRTLNIYTSLYGAAEKATQSEHVREGGRWSRIPTCDWHRSDWGWGCNHFVAYSFNGNDNCWLYLLCRETEELQALQVRQVNRRTWRRSTEAIKSSFVTRMRCSKMPTHAKDKVLILHETKNKSKTKIILMVKKCSGSC